MTRGGPGSAWRTGVLALAAFLGASVVCEPRLPQLHAAVGVGRIAGLVQVKPRGPRHANAPGVYPSRRILAVPPASSRNPQDTLVYLADPPADFVPAPQDRVMIQRDEAFAPHLLAVTTGSRVSFPNEDPIFHNVFSLSNATSFDLGRYPQGQTRTQRFERPGVVKLFCHIHASMSAIVIVLDHPFYSTPDADGRFAIDDVPPGTHVVRAWHERAGETAASVTVAAGETATVHFDIPVVDR